MSKLLCKRLETEVETNALYTRKQSQKKYERVKSEFFRFLQYETLHHIRIFCHRLASMGMVFGAPVSWLY